MQLSWRGSFRLNPSRKKWKRLLSKFIVSYAVHVYFEGTVIKKKGGGEGEEKATCWLIKKPSIFLMTRHFCSFVSQTHWLMGKVQSRCLLRAVWSAFLFFFFICYVLGVFNPRDTAVCYRTPLCYVTFCFSYVEEKCLNRIERDRWLGWRMKELTP